MYGCGLYQKSQWKKEDQNLQACCLNLNFTLTELVMVIRRQLKTLTLSKCSCAKLGEASPTPVGAETSDAVSIFVVNYFVFFHVLLYVPAQWMLR